MEFKLHAPFEMMGDQPEAVKNLVEGIKSGKKHQTLLGVTGSGKTFTMANVIAQVQKPTLIISHNKTLAAQLCGEFKEFFPENSVEYFISYYDYYQPEAYVPSTDTYIEKDSDVNEEIDRLRYSATAALMERKDVIIVASVSCIYGLGSPDEYVNQMISLRPGMEKSRNDILRELVDIQYERNDLAFERGTFRVRGDIIDVIPAGGEHAIRIEMFGDEIDSLKELDPLTGEVIATRSHVAIFPASHYATSKEHMEKALVTIEEELEDRIKYFKERGQLLEAQRIEQRTRYDLEMMREIGSCKGIENYSRHLVGNPPGAMPYTLIDYFPDDFLIIVDESHAMLPQLRAMANGDRARKTSLVDYGFRLPSALDNRPLRFEEFESKVNQIIYVSATPAEYEKEKAEGISAQQVIRPTGLLDPPIQIVPTEGQIDHLIGEINKEVALKRRVLVTTLTKKMAENLTEYLKTAGIKCKYMHSDIESLERNEILRDLRLGEFDVLVGINLLREGLDLPEVSLVAILDADKEGFLRTETSLIQTVGRASRNVNGRVIMYADTVSKAMRACIDETTRRRDIQKSFNEANGITPHSVEKSIRDIIEVTTKVDEDVTKLNGKSLLEFTKKELKEYADKLEKEMREAAKELQFERAAILRDRLLEVRNKL